MKKIKTFLYLTKYRIALLSTLSGVLGFYIIKKELISILIFYLSLYLLASGSLAMNQYIERDFDRLMERTKKRPIINKELSSTNAFLIAILLLSCGLLIMYLKFGLLSFLTGFTAFFIYIFIYTPLKRKTPFAFFPGALIGAIPPITGWVSAGGEIFSPIIISLSLYFFIWQVPHFLILFYNLSEDYKRAGFKSIKDVFPENIFKAIIYTWVSATLLFSFVFPLFGVINSKNLFLIFVIFSIIMLFIFSVLIKDLKNSKKIFNLLNFYTLSLITFIFIFHHS